MAATDRARARAQANKARRDAEEAQRLVELQQQAHALDRMQQQQQQHHERMQQMQQAAEARQQAMAAHAQLQAQREQQLSVEGEVVEICSAGGTWVALLPAAPTNVALNRWMANARAGSIVPHHHGLLDTGNAARTMLHADVCTRAGIVAAPNAPTMVIHGINGAERYALVPVRVRIRAFEIDIWAAVGGNQGALVGMDVIGPMFDSGFAISGHRANRRALINQAGQAVVAWQIVAE